MDGMRQFYERELTEVREELRFIYKKWSSWSIVGGYGMNEINIALTIVIIYREPRGARSLKRDSSGKLRPLLAPSAQ